MKFSLSNREPLITRGLIVALVSALLTLLESFGVPLTQDQQAAINQLVAVLGPLLVALLARSQVTPVDDPHDREGRRLTPEGE